MKFTRVIDYISLHGTSPWISVIFTIRDDYGADTWRLLSRLNNHHNELLDTALSTIVCILISKVKTFPICLTISLNCFKSFFLLSMIIIKLLTTESKEHFSFENLFNWNVLQFHKVKINCKINAMNFLSDSFMSNVFLKKSYIMLQLFNLSNELLQIRM
jgi:hypothetical protein